MGRFFIGLSIGIVAGAAIIFFTLVGVPRASKVPGNPVAPPDAATAGQSAEIILKQDFFNQVLARIFQDINSPAFRMAQLEGDHAVKPEFASMMQPQNCDGDIKVLQQGSGVTTSISFDNDRIAAPLAFSGNFGTPFGCVNFTGWASTHLDLRYDADQKVLFGQVTVDTVNLDGVNPVVGGIITPFVQSTLNNRVNPVRILDGKQIAIDLPIASAGGNLKAQVADVRAAVKGGILDLYVVYDFRGVRTE